MFVRPACLIRRSVITLLILVMTQSLVSCGPPAARATMPTSPPTAVPTETATPAPTETPTASETPFIPRATVKVMAQLPLSGQEAAAGTDLQRAVEMAVGDLAGPLNQLGYEVQLVSYDDKSEVKTAVANAREIVGDPQILCGVGHYYSSVTMQAAEIYHAAGLPFISPSNTNAKVTSLGYVDVNRVAGRDDSEGAAAAQFAKSQGFAAVYILQNNYEPLKKNGEFFKREADRIGLKVVGVLSTDVSDDFSAIVKRVMNTGADFVYFAGSAGQAGPFFRQVREAGFAGGVMVMDSNPALAELAGPRLSEGKGAYYIDTAVPVSAFPGAATFAERFETLYGAAPHTYAAQAYDAAGICLKAIEETSRNVAGNLPTREQVAKAIRGIVDYPGITGTYNFDKRGDPTLSKYFVYKVTSVDPGGWPQNPVAGTFDVAPPK